LAAPGRVEGSDDAISIGASTTGVVEKVAVVQGDLIKKGDLLLRIMCDDLAAQLKQRKAEFEASEALYSKLVHGARPEEISIAETDVMLAEARVAEAQLRSTRTETLVDRAAASTAVRDTDARDFRMAMAQLAAAKFRLQLLRAGTRQEELAEANARMRSTSHSVEVTSAELAKCEVKSPINGIVLRKFVSEGELVSTYYPRPLFTVSEIQKYRVRAEVDEQDIAKIKLGQSVEVVAGALQEKRLKGRVSKISPIMGRRQILTSDPADKNDRDVLEVIADLDEKPAGLPIGLRVSVLFFQ
jgi:HlyD family secretion protein